MGNCVQGRSLVVLQGAKPLPRVQTAHGWSMGLHKGEPKSPFARSRCRNTGLSCEARRAKRGRGPAGKRWRASNPRRVGQVSKGHEGSLVDGGPGGEAKSPPVSMKLSWGFQGSRNAPLNGDATARRCAGAGTGSMPGKRHRPGGSNGGAQRAPLARWCCSTTHILQCAL